MEYYNFRRRRLFRLLGEFRERRKRARLNPIIGADAIPSDQGDIDYILAVTEQGIAKAVGTAGPKSVVQMIRMCLQQLSTSESPRQRDPVPIQLTGKQINGTPFGGLPPWRVRIRLPPANEPAANLFTAPMDASWWMRPVRIGSLPR
jgi:hypothetical protein